MIASRPQDARAALAASRPAVLVRRVVADLDTPVSAWLKLVGPEGRHAILLESVEGGATLGRYSVIAFDPDLVWRCRDGVARIDRGHGFEDQPGPALAALRALLAESAIALPPGLPPMSAGLFGYLGYEMVRQMERLPPRSPRALDVDDAVLMRPRLVAIFDNIRRDVTLVAPIYPTGGEPAELVAAAEARLAAAADRLAAPLTPPPAPAGPVTLGVPASNTGQARFEAMVETCKDYIRAGDAYQVVPSHRVSLAFPLPALALYRTLRRINPSPFLFLVALPELDIIGSSPEILVRVREGRVAIRPLAGTRPRGATPDDDTRLATELLADPKERAEHLMLLDLGRNDVGRVAEAGSVAVSEAFTIERYSHVMHIVSHVEGRLRSDRDALDALIAGFPAGTLSGAPKVRAMEIIDELEVARREIYAGAVGYFGADGAMDTCIALRTAVLKDGVLHLQAGGGVVADSDPTAEWEETQAKIRGLLRAAEAAVALANGEA